MILAAREGHIDVVKLLLDDDRKYRSMDFTQALTEAEKRGHTDVVKLLEDNKWRW